MGKGVHLTTHPLEAFNTLLKGERQVRKGESSVKEILNLVPLQNNLVPCALGRESLKC